MAESKILVVTEDDGSKWVQFEDFQKLQAENGRLKCCGNCDLYGHYCDPYSEGKIKDAGICDDWRPWEDQEARP